MNKKNLISQMVKPVNPITIQGLPTELAELSKEELQLVIGGVTMRPDGSGCTEPYKHGSKKGENKDSVVVILTSKTNS